MGISRSQTRYQFATLFPRKRLIKGLATQGVGGGRGGVWLPPAKYGLILILTTDDLLSATISRGWIHMINLCNNSLQSGEWFKSCGCGQNFWGVVNVSGVWLMSPLHY